MADYSNILVVIPSLDPDERLLKVIRGVQEKGFSDILLVDDGSAPENQHYFEEGAALGCAVLHHGVNKGKGRALKTAFEWFLQNRPDAQGADHLVFLLVEHRLHVEPRRVVVVEGVKDEHQYTARDEHGRRGVHHKLQERAGP